MKKIFIILSIILASFTSKATIHVVKVWDGYYQFMDADITIQLGDTVQWLPLLGVPTMVHTITSTNIPVGAATFDQIWQAPADTFFQYVPQIAGHYEYECTPHAISHGMVGSINVIDGVNGITDDALTQSHLHIYPNPTTGFFHFSESSVDYEYKIFTPNGRLLLSGRTNDVVNISNLANGIYHIVIVGNKPRNMNLVKQ
jgi:plastocyanin